MDNFEVILPWTIRMLSDEVVKGLSSNGKIEIWKIPIMIFLIFDIDYKSLLVVIMAMRILWANHKSLSDGRLK